MHKMDLRKLNKTQAYIYRNLIFECFLYVIKFNFDINTTLA